MPEEVLAHWPLQSLIAPIAKARAYQQPAPSRTEQVLALLADGIPVQTSAEDVQVALRYVYRLKKRITMVRLSPSLLNERGMRWHAC